MKLRDTEPPTVEQAYQYALRLLGARDYTSLKLRQKLFARSIIESDVEVVIKRLNTEGWLNDNRFAERFTESVLLSGRFFGQRLQMELRRRGVSKELAAETAGRMQQEYDEIKEMRSVLERHYPGFSFDTATNREKRRVIAYLQRRGFSSSAIGEALHKRTQE